MKAIRRLLTPFLVAACFPTRAPAQIIEKTLTVPTEQTAGFEIPHAAAGGQLKLTLVPASRLEITGSEIVEEDSADEVMWMRTAAEKTGHVFEIGGVFSSRHYLHVKGTLAPLTDGKASSVPVPLDFDAYAPAVDIDVAGKSDPDPVTGVDPEPPRNSAPP